ncbi:receptor-transporting protein 3-like [Heptranchias perlo]|uniref:receptor-transporting protein 3-like n=1 Tax=Heptranchias perlo TaxID=212740 RepID=UPI003559A930
MPRMPGTNPWFDSFARCMEELEYEATWTLNLNYNLNLDLNEEQKKAGWKIYKTSTFGRFDCSNCPNSWSSAHVVILFHYRLRVKPSRGSVLLRPFRQQCRNCWRIPSMLKPQVKPTQMQQVFERLISKILKNCYMQPVEADERNLLHRKTKPHERTLCEACSLGMCSNTGTFPCKRRRCNTCPFISPLRDIQGPKDSFHVTKPFTCTSANLVYCILCSKCDFLYVGETERRLGDRFAEHLRSVRTRNPNLRVACHFNSPSHSESDLFVLGLQQCSNDAERKREEKRIIKLLGI